MADDYSFFNIGPTTSDLSAAVDANSLYSMPSDVTDAVKMLPAADTGTPWWQTVITTGLPKIIDNMTTKPTVAGTVSPGTAAGQNGQTYQMTSTPSSPSTGAGVVARNGGGMGMLGLLGILGLGLLAMHG